MLLWRLSDRGIDFEENHFSLFKNVLRVDKLECRKFGPREGGNKPIRCRANHVDHNFRARFDMKLNQMEFFESETLTWVSLKTCPWQTDLNYGEFARDRDRLDFILRENFGNYWTRSERCEDFWMSACDVSSRKSCQMSITCCVNLALSKRILHHESYYDSFPDLGRHMTHLWMWN